MGSFFDKILAPEPNKTETVNPVKTSENLAELVKAVPAKLDPVVENIMANAQAMVSGNKNPSNGVNLTEAVKALKANENNNVLREVEPNVSKLPPIQIPEGVAPLSPVSLEIPVEKTEGIKNEVAQTKEVTKPEEKYENYEAPERIFVSQFLDTFNKVLVLGKKLEDLNQLRTENAKSFEVINKENEIKSSDRKNIEASLKALLDVEEGGKEELLNILKDFQTYIEGAEEYVAKQIKNERMSDNKLLAEINASKIEINKLIEQLGGTASFDKTKTAVRVAEKVGKNGLEKIKTENVSPETINMVHGKVVETYAENPVDVKMLGADIVGQIINIWSEKIKI